MRKLTRERRVDIVWGLVLAAMAGALIIFVLDAWGADGSKTPAWLAAVACALVVGGFGAVIASESRRHRREGDAWPKAVLRGTGNGFRFLWELFF